MQHTHFTSDRMTMNLLTKEHASIVHPVFQDPSLFTYIPEDPLELQALEKRYAFWERRESPDKSEYWLNYIIFLASTGEFVGTLQATVHQNTKEASIAYMIASRFQGQGLGTEATQAMITHLIHDYDVQLIKAWIDTRNMSSIRLVEKLGFKKIKFLPKADHFKGEDSDEFIFQLDQISCRIIQLIDM